MTVMTTDVVSIPDERALDKAIALITAHQGQSDDVQGFDADGEPFQINDSGTLRGVRRAEELTWPAILILFRLDQHWPDYQTRTLGMSLLPDEIANTLGGPGSDTNDVLASVSATRYPARYAYEELGRTAPAMRSGRCQKARRTTGAILRHHDAHPGRRAPGPLLLPTGRLRPTESAPVGDNCRHGR